MRKIIVVVVTVLIIISIMAVSNASSVILPVPSPHKVADKPVRYTSYHSYLAGDGTVTLRKYIKAPTQHNVNPYVGKKIVSIKKRGASDEQNKAIERVLRECGSLDAVLTIEAESGWIVDRVAKNGDAGLWQWSPIWNYEHSKPENRNWDYQIKVGCEKFRALADVNEVRYSSRWKDWRTAEGGYWHGMANAYNPSVLARFEIVTQ